MILVTGCNEMIKCYKCEHVLVGLDVEIFLGGTTKCPKCGAENLI